MLGRRMVFVACSLDGFIAGPDDDLTFLEPAAEQEIEDTFTPFFANVGALLMGRRTFDVVSGFGGDWPYGTTPVLVLTHRSLDFDVPTVRAVSGPLERAVADAAEAAGARNVYLDGGEVVRQALDAGLVDELIVTVAPRLLGQGIPLFAGLTQRRDLVLQGHRSLGAGFIELTYRPRSN